MSRVAMVDDNEADLAALKQALELVEFDGELALYTSGRDFYTALASGKVPDVLILDLNMPPPTGWEVLDHVRASGLPCLVVVYSSSSARLERDRAITKGAFGYLEKPSSFAGLKGVARAVKDMAKARKTPSGDEPGA